MQRLASGKGYSLFELVMTLGLACLIFGLALPSFGFLLADQRLRAESDALFHAVHLARKMSIVRRRVITLCASRDRQTCDAEGRWSHGWILFENNARTGVSIRTPDEKVLIFHDVDPAVTIAANRLSFSFRSTHLRATNGTLIVCSRGDSAPPRAVVVSYTGRPRVARADTAGKPYTCAR